EPVKILTRAMNVAATTQHTANFEKSSGRWTSAAMAAENNVNVMNVKNFSSPYSLYEVTATMRCKANRPNMMTTKTRTQCTTGRTLTTSQSNKSAATAAAGAAISVSPPGAKS